ncbi:hypothetical protein PPERSA_05399 [Pseudocohnilembus persalinus]|uniref:C2H2-type domain-containing protein n=1 Tax=Pseudocohnilembus persalinus TaxID=266149 RepID=A0A0V0R7X5_PSEPJ|nr:hypothetical protein PPERSA_05399 [Pseudocohnilembus persalinus]|eukprot:KRX10579.1 hypothetical protein PPERSA_05399 [Pseudocohnilembus persalinus]
MSYDPQNDFSDRQNNHMMGMNQNQNSYQNQGPNSPGQRPSMGRVNDQYNNNNYNYNNQYNNNNQYNDLNPINNNLYNDMPMNMGNNQHMGQNSYNNGPNQEMYQTDRKSVVSSSRVSSPSGSQSEVGQNKLKKPSELKTQSLKINGLQVINSKFSTKIHYGKKQFAYEFSEIQGDQVNQRGNKKKIEIQFSDIMDIKVLTKENIITVFTQTLPKQLQQVEINGKTTWEQKDFVMELQTQNQQIIDFNQCQIFEFESTYTRNQLTKNGQTRTSHLDKIRETRLLPLNVDGHQEFQPKYRNNSMPQRQGSNQNYHNNQGGNMYRGGSQVRGGNNNYNNGNQQYMGGGQNQMGDDNYQNNNNRQPNQFNNQRGGKNMGPPPPYQRNSSVNSQDQWDYPNQQGNQRPPSQGYNNQNYSRNEPISNDQYVGNNQPLQNYPINKGGNQQQQYVQRDQQQRDPQYMQQRGGPPPHPNIQQQSHLSQASSGGQYRNNQNSSQELNYNEMTNRVPSGGPPRSIPQNQQQNIIQGSRPNSISNMNNIDNRGNNNMPINQNQIRSHSSNSLNQSGHIQPQQRENIGPLPGPVGPRTPQQQMQQQQQGDQRMRVNNQGGKNNGQNGQYYQQSQFGRQQQQGQQGGPGPNYQQGPPMPPGQQRGQPPMQNLPPNKNNSGVNNRFPPGQQGNLNNIPPQQGQGQIRMSGVNQMMGYNNNNSGDYNQNLNNSNINMRQGQQFGNNQQQQGKQQVVMGKKTKKSKLQEEKMNMEMNRNNQMPLNNQNQGPLMKGANQNQNNMGQPVPQPPPKKQKDNDKLFLVEINENRIKQLRQYNSQIIKNGPEERLKEIIQKNNLEPINKTQNNKCPYSKCQKQFKTISQFQQHFKKKHYELNELLQIDENGFVKVNEKGLNFAQMISELFPKFNEHSLEIMRKQLKSEQNQEEKPIKKNKQERSNISANLVNTNVSVNSTSVSLQNFNN